MESIFEQIVTTYLTCGGKVFIVPQYSIPTTTGRGDWSCPDILALDFGAKEVVVVEVATGYRPASLVSRVAERETRWFGPIRAKLMADGLSEQAGWKIRFLGFVRRDSLEATRRSFVGQESDVAFTAIEDVTFPWVYWEIRVAGGLPR